MLLEIILLYQKKQCTLILCGSSIRMMEAQVLKVHSMVEEQDNGK